MICELLGVDGSQWPRFFDWSEAVIPGEVEQTEEQRAAHQIEMWEYLIGVAEERRKAPADDLVSVLATRRIRSRERRRRAERGRAGHVPDPAAGGRERDDPQPDLGRTGGARRNPAQWAALRADRSLIPSAVEELLRWTTPVISFMRTATAATTIRGVEVAAGDPVLLVYASANRDEEVFGADAGELRIDRHPNPHVSFGFGPHFCLGAALARLEGRVVLVSCSTASRRWCRPGRSSGRRAR